MRYNRIHTLHWLAVAAAVLLAACAPGGDASAEALDRTGTFDGVTVSYTVVLPDSYDPERAYPGVLAFTGGGQNAAAVERHVERFWRAEAEKRGYIVISPAAPGGRLFFQGGERIFPAFLDEILRTYKIEGGRFHIAGASNGGISALHIAALHPRYFRSVTGMPGYLPQASTARIEALRGMCVYMHVGERDTPWRQTMAEQSRIFERMGLDVRFAVEPGEEHQIRSLGGDGAARLYDQLEACD